MQKINTLEGLPVFSKKEIQNDRQLVSKDIHQYHCMLIDENGVHEYCRELHFRSVTNLSTHASIYATDERKVQVSSIDLATHATIELVRERLKSRTGNRKSRTGNDVLCGRAEFQIGISDFDFASDLIKKFGQAIKDGDSFNNAMIIFLSDAARFNIEFHSMLIELNK